MATEIERHEVVNLAQASKQFRLDPRTLRSRVRSGELPTFVDPFNRTVKLVRVADLESMRQIRPAQQTAVRTAR